MKGEATITEDDSGLHMIHSFNDWGLNWSYFILMFGIVCSS
jgi:hypothetical protein